LSQAMCALRLVMDHGNFPRSRRRKRRSFGQRRKFLL
jgi:hypothetical protein